MSYLIKLNKKEKFYLYPHDWKWQNIFPDTEDGKDISKPFKYEDNFKPHKMSKFNYLIYLVHQMTDECVDVERYFLPKSQKIKQWCGNDKVVFCPSHFKEIDDIVLTGSLDPSDKIGLLNHYITKARFTFKAMKSVLWMWRVTKLQRLTSRFKSNKNGFAFSQWKEIKKDKRSENPGDSVWTVMKFGEAKKRKVT